MAIQEDKRAPMASAPMLYRADGAVDWGNMWDSFCVLAQDGGPPHRATMLNPGDAVDPQSVAYREVVAEIVRGIDEVCGFSARAAEPGWIAMRCPSSSMARWLSEAIVQENVQARVDDTDVLLPTGADYALTGQIKNVITAVAKTTHYWDNHITPEAKSGLAFQEKVGRWKTRAAGWFGRR